jgi:hypothetical protein
MIHGKLAKLTECMDKNSLVEMAAQALSTA